jgi:hypothetical protein
MFRALSCWLFLLLLAARPGYSQNKPAALPSRKVLTVRLTLPTVVGKLGEMAGWIPRAAPSEKNSPTRNPVVTLAVPLPRFLSSSAPAPRQPYRE